jgi:hypothetical protein
VINPVTKERVEVEIDVGGRATISVPLETMAVVRSLLSKSRISYSGGNSIFSGSQPGLWSTITLPPGADVEQVQQILDSID